MIQMIEGYKNLGELIKEVNQEKWFINEDGLAGSTDELGIKELFLDEFVEEDEDIKYVLITSDNVEEDQLVRREEIIRLIESGSLKIEYVEMYDHAIGTLDNKSVRIEYL